MTGMSAERLEEIRASLGRGEATGAQLLEQHAEIVRLRGIFKLIAGPCDRWRAGSGYTVFRERMTHAKDGRPLAIMGAPSCLEDGAPSVACCPSCKARGALGLRADDDVPA